MAPLKRSPGPAARSAFRSGALVAALAGLVGIAYLYWADVLNPLSMGYALLMLFPVYMVVVAVVLSVWLGYDKDATDLRPVHREKDPEQ